MGEPAVNPLHLVPSPRPQAEAPAFTSPQRRNVLIVGAGQRGLMLARQLEGHPAQHRHVVGFVDDDPDKLAECNGFRILGGTSAILEVVRRHNVDEIVVAYVPTWQELLLQQLVETGEDERVHVLVLPTLYEAVIGGLPVETIDDIPLLEANGHRPTAAYQATKRILDVVLAVALLGATAPVTALAALAIKLTSPGPVIFRQRRVGYRGREFTIYKLRTMVVDAEAATGPVLATPTDRRVTPIGQWLRRTHLDELPQLVNVLRGDMALVGPRPERPEFVAQFARQVHAYLKRLEVMPGITGLAQVYGGYGTSVYDKLKYDWMYTCKGSLTLDLLILLRTVGVVLGRRGC